MLNCDADADEELRDYYYIEAVQCKCSLCKSSQAVCESLALEMNNQLENNEVSKLDEYQDDKVRREKESIY